MRIVIIGRSETLYDTAILLRTQGHEIIGIITAKEAPEYKRNSEDFAALAKEIGIPFAHNPKISAADSIWQEIDSPQIGISFNYPGVIPQAVIDFFPYGILNAHGGDLPRYRGNACQAWAIINGEKRIGLCIHKMVGGELDSGAIISRDYLDISLNTKITEVYEWILQRSPLLFINALTSLLEDKQFVLEFQSADSCNSLRCYPRNPSDGRINWKNNATDILRLINASNKPYTGAFCFFEGKKVIIWDAELAEYENFLAVPGQLTQIGTPFVDVATGLGKLRVKLIETESGVVEPRQLVRSVRQRFE